MRLLQHISVIVIGLIYLISSSGIIIYESHCSCTGEEQVSVFVSPKTCEVEFHQHHQHNDDGTEVSSLFQECHECSDHSYDCGCSSPEVKFFKLINQLVDEEVLFIKAKQILVTDIYVQEIIQLVNNSDEAETVQCYIDPPEIVNSSLDFLIQIQQLKIPNIA